MTTTLNKDWTTWTLESVQKALRPREDCRYWDENAVEIIGEALPVITDYEILDFFLNRSTGLLDRAVLNPLVTAEQLEKFASSKSAIVRCGVAANPNLTERICEILIESENENGGDCWDDIYLSMCAHFGGTLPEKLLFKCILELGDECVDEDDGNIKIYTTSTDAESLTAIMNTGASVCEYIGLNHIWTDKQREEWVKSEHEYVRAGMACKQTPRRLLEILANDSSDYVRKSAISVLEELDNE